MSDLFRYPKSRTLVREQHRDDEIDFTYPTGADYLFEPKSTETKLACGSPMVWLDGHEHVCIKPMGHTDEGDPVHQDYDEWSALRSWESH